MKNQWTVVGKGNMGQPLYQLLQPDGYPAPLKAPPMGPLEWMCIVIYGIIFVSAVSIIFGAGYLLGHYF